MTYAFNTHMLPPMITVAHVINTISTRWDILQPLLVVRTYSNNNSRYASFVYGLSIHFFSIASSISCMEWQSVVYKRASLSHYCVYTVASYVLILTSSSHVARVKIRTKLGSSNSGMPFTKGVYEKTIFQIILPPVLQDY